MVVVKWRHRANGLLHLAVCALRFYMYLFMSLTFWDLLFQKPSQEEVEKFKEYILEKFDDNSDGKISMCEVRTIQWLSLISKGFVVCFGLPGRRDGFLSYSSHLIYPLRASCLHGVPPFILITRNGLHFLPRLPSCFCSFLFNRSAPRWFLIFLFFFLLVPKLFLCCSRRFGPVLV